MINKGLLYIAQGTILDVFFFTQCLIITYKRKESEKEYTHTNTHIYEKESESVICSVVSDFL